MPWGTNCRRDAEPTDSQKLKPPGVQGGESAELRFDGDLVSDVRDKTFRGSLHDVSVCASTGPLGCAAPHGGHSPGAPAGPWRKTTEEREGVVRAPGSLCCPAEIGTTLQTNHTLIFFFNG